MSESQRYELFNSDLDVGGNREDDDLVQFAIRMRSVAARPVAADSRRDIWASVVDAQTSGAVAQSFQRFRGLNSGRAPRANQLLRRMPAPAAFVVAIAIAIIFAISGFGGGGGDMVTPTVHAEHAATAEVSPFTVAPTSTIDQP